MRARGALSLQGGGSAESGCGEGAGVGAGAGRTQGLTELLPSQQEALAAGSLGPRRHGPRGGDRGCWELSQPSPPRQPRSPVLFTQAHSSAPSSTLTLGPLPKITDPCGQEHVPVPCLLSSLQANLSTCSARTCHGHSQLWAFVSTAPSAWNALTTSLAWLASMCPSDLCLLPHHFLQEAFLDCPVGGGGGERILSLGSPHCIVSSLPPIHPTKRQTRVWG